MADLALDFEWEDPGGARGEELRATWSRLTVTAGEDVVTRVLDLRTRGVRNSVYVPLYPIAEWIASNWWRLLYEVRSPRAPARNGYEARHCLTAASEGFALPALSFEPMGETLRLSWNAKEFFHRPLEFVGDGVAHVSRDCLEERLIQFVEAVVGRLEDEGIHETLLHEEWNAIRGMSSDEESFCRLAGTLGLDPFRIDDEQADQIVEVAARIPEALHDELFSAADPSILAAEATALGTALDELSGRHPSLDRLRDLREEVDPLRSTEHLPWRQGYEAARSLRAALSLNGDPLSTFESLGAAFRVEGSVLEREVRAIRGVVAVDGVVALDDRQRPGFGVRATAPEARRFAFCRELFEYLASEGTEPSIVTRAGTHRQQRNRAFAAELLLPSDALRSRAPADVVGYQWVDEIAAEFGVSWAVVSHQLEKHHIARISPD
ncbi:MAG: ImmA/IrrE family metallo-endopeptidase [Acidobacteriota bacterium]|jgi:hypothetical protein